MQQRHHSKSPESEPVVPFVDQTPGEVILLALVLIVLAALICYHNSFRGAFVFDDAYWITRNASIRHLWPIWQVLMPPKELLVRGRPVVSLTLAVNYALGGMNVWGYHAVNLAIHVLAAWTLFGVVRRTLLLPRLSRQCGALAMPLALIVTLLWMIHPLQTESVDYIIQRSEALVGLFCLLALYCVIRGATSAESMSWYAGAVAACLMGMATKELMVTAPVIILLYDRTFLAGTFREAWRRRWRLYLAMATTWGVVLALLVSADFYGGTTGFAVQKFTWWSYLLTQPGVIVHYLGLTFWPSRLCLDYGWRAAQSIDEILVPGLVVVGLLALTVRALMKWPAWGFLGAWFFVILAPTSSFVPIQDAAFEHRMYLSLAAVVAGVVIGIWLAGQWLVDRRMISASVLPIAGGALALLAGAALGVLTVQRNADYRDDVTIWQDTVVKAPGNERAHANLGLGLVGRGLLDQGIAEYQTALDIRLDFEAVHNDLGLALAKRGRFDEAIAHHQAALKLNPDSPGGHNSLGAAFGGAGRTDEAIQEYQKAIELDPDFAEAYFNVGSTYLGGHRFDEAIVWFQKAIRVNPDYVEAYNNLGSALVSCGRIDEALADYQKALELRPDYPNAHHNIGIAMAIRGEPDQAIVHFRKAVELDPSHAAAHNNLGKALLGLGRREEAAVHFRKALEIKPDYAEARQNLAIALGQDAKTK